MTRRDYVLITGAIREARATLNAHQHALTASDAIHAVIKELQRALKSENVRFDADRFWSECYR